MAAFSKQRTTAWRSTQFSTSSRFFRSAAVAVASSDSNVIRVGTGEANALTASTVAALIRVMRQKLRLLVVDHHVDSWRSEYLLLSTDSPEKSSRSDRRK